MEIAKLYDKINKYRDSFAENNRNTLMRILNDNSGTEFGTEYGFITLDTEERYRSSVPISHYSDYDGYIQRMYLGEKNLLYRYDTYSFLETSGSTDAGKLIPISVRSLEQFGDDMDRYLQEHARTHGGRRLLVSFLRTDLGKKSVRHDTMLFTASYYRYLYEKGLLPTDVLAGGKELNFYASACDFLYAKLWIAFAYGDLCTLESVYLYDLLIFFRYMEEHYEEVISDMEQGSAAEDKDIPPEIRSSLGSIPVDHDRLAMIRKECEKGFDGIAARLWPGLSLISGIGSKAFQVEEISLKKYTADIPVWHYIYAASECVMAVPSGTDTYDYILLPGNAYFEFLSVDEERVVLPRELRIDSCYELVLTTFSGLYRYAMGDMIRVTGFEGSVPVIRFMYRRNLVMNIAGEKLSMDTLDRVVRRWSRETGNEVWQYYFYEDYSQMPACYHGVIATSDGKSVIIDKDEIDVFERILREFSKDYDDLRRLRTIRRAEIEFVDKDEIMTRQSERNSGAGQPKPVHIWRKAHD
ncbi:MAG: GH3 auxin-responsive promoter family protein [Lachnospiraceae bacterium]|nr:GH3 auxin-responsive promoter family protein [Lachnospiraceae bacterium]